jgi:hypothetical protein
MENNGAKMSLHSVSSLWSDTWAAYKRSWAVLVEIVLLPTLVTILGYIFLYLGFPFSVIGGVIVFVGWIIFMFSVLPVIYSIHNATGVDASYRATIGWFWPFVWVTIIEILAVMGGMFMLIIPGMWLAVALSFMSYIFVMEHRRGLDALRQSKDYIKGYWWAVVGRTLLLGLLFIVASIVVQIPVSLIFGKMFSSVVSMAMALFFIPFSAIYQYFIFQNLRELKPALAEAQPSKGKGFIKASAIVGIVAFVFLIISLTLVWAFLVQGDIRFLHHGDGNLPPVGNTQGSLQQH